MPVQGDNSGERPDVEETVRRLASMPNTTPDERIARGAEIDRSAEELNMSRVELAQRVQDASGEVATNGRGRGARGGDDSAADTAQRSLAAGWVEANGADWRYIDDQNVWRVWQDGRWARDDKRLIRRAVGAYLEGVVLTENIKGKSRLTILGAGFLPGVVQLIADREGIAVSVDAFDRDPYLLGTPGGTVDLRTGLLRPADPADMIAMQAGATPTPGAGCPLFLAFLSQVMCGRQDLVDYLLDYLGLALVGKQLEHVLLFMIGGGRNGKSVLLEVLLGVFGEYGGKMPDNLLLERRHEEHTTELMTLKGKRLVIGSEVPEKARWNEARVKQLTGGDAVLARRMREDNELFSVSHSFVFAANDAPRTTDLSYAMRQRLRFLPFDFTVPAGAEDHNLAQKLLEERDGILRLLVGRCVNRLNQGGVRTPPDAVAARSAEYFDAQNPVLPFLAECCDMVESARTATEKLFRAFQQWHSGEVRMSVGTFGQYLTKAGVAKGIGKIGKARPGIQLKPEVEHALSRRAGELDLGQEPGGPVREGSAQEPSEAEWAARHGPPPGSAATSDEGPEPGSVEPEEDGQPGDGSG